MRAPYPYEGYGGGMRYSKCELWTKWYFHQKINLQSTQKKEYPVFVGRVVDHGLKQMSNQLFLGKCFNDISVLTVQFMNDQHFFIE